MSVQPKDLSGLPDRAERERRVLDGLRGLQLSGAIFLRAHFSAPWAYVSPSCEEVVQMLRPGARRVMLFHIFTEGRCRLQLHRPRERGRWPGHRCPASGKIRRRVARPVSTGIRRRFGGRGARRGQLPTPNLQLPRHSQRPTPNLAEAGVAFGTESSPMPTPNSQAEPARRAARWELGVGSALEVGSWRLGVRRPARP